MKTFTVQPKSIDDDSQNILNVQNSMEKFFQEMDVKYRVENDGIGPNEYWGVKSVDNGKDTIEIEDYEDIKLIIINKDKTMSNEELLKFATDLVENTSHTRCIEIESKKLSQNITINITNVKIENSTLSCDLTWMEI